MFQEEQTNIIAVMKFIISWVKTYMSFAWILDTEFCYRICKYHLQVMNILSVLCCNELYLGYNLINYMVLSFSEAGHQ
jgi:hypothetical protein